ncbi:MAG: PQQ-dependent sugar dehydrogenase [Bacteroidota bacterium]
MTGVWRNVPECATAVAALLFVLTAGPRSATAQDDGAPRVALELTAEGFTHPVMLAEPPDDTGRIFVVDQTGQIWIVSATGERLGEPFLDIEDRIVEMNEHYDERGLLGLAFHPDYATNGRFYVFYSAPLRERALDNFDHTNVLAEFRVSEGDPGVADPGSERKLLEIDHPYTNHNAGTLAFGPDDYLYVALGDGGNRDDQDAHFVQGHVQDWYDVNDGGNGQDIENNLLGSILRIDVSAEGGGHHGGEQPYVIPEDNPFTDIPGVMGEVWAYGFRNPYRFSFDMEEDRQLIVGDAGQNMFEEINLVTKGGNYGWNVMEGRHCFNSASPTDPFEECPTETGVGHPVEGNPLILPVIEARTANHFQEDVLGLVVIGGYVYRGERLSDAFKGKYIFGAFSRGEHHTQEGEEHLPGRIFAARRTGTEDWPYEEVLISNRPDGQLDGLLLSFGQDRKGEIYVLVADEPGPVGNTGRVYRFGPSQ